MKETPTSSPRSIAQEVGPSYGQEFARLAQPMPQIRAGRVRRVRYHQSESSAGLPHKLSRIFAPKDPVDSDYCREQQDHNHIFSRAIEVVLVHRAVVF